MGLPGLLSLQKNPQAVGKGGEEAKSSTSGELGGLILLQVLSPNLGHPKCRADVGNQSAFSGELGEMGFIGAALGTALVCNPWRNLMLWRN